MLYMKKIIITLIAAIITCITCYAQSRRVHFKNEYKVIDTLVINNLPSVYPTNDGDYLITLPKEQNLIIAYNNDRTKAIVLRGYPHGKHMEFNVKYDGVRLILWYKDEHIYCGYIYDEKLKACQYVEAINDAEKDRIVKRFPFLRPIPTFTNND